MLVQMQIRSYQMQVTRTLCITVDTKPELREPIGQLLDTLSIVQILKYISVFLVIAFVIAVVALVLVLDLAFLSWAP